MAENDNRIGMVDAYAFAVAGGYQGTREDFQRVSALLPESVEELEDIKQSVSASEENAAGSATSASQSATQASGYANNASASATQASGYEQDSADSAEDSEAWAVGQRGGVDVPSTDPAYENNAKYYAEQSQGVVDNTLAALGISIVDGALCVTYNEA